MRIKDIKPELTAHNIPTDAIFEKSGVVAIGFHQITALCTSVLYRNKALVL